MSDKELFENAKMMKDVFVEQQRPSVLQMDLKDFLEENIAENHLRTRMVNWIYRCQEIVTVGALVKYCQDCDYSHPLLGMRYIGRDCEKAITEALNKYGISIDKKVAIGKQESKSTTMRVFIHDSNEDFVEAFDDWNMPLPLVGDKVGTKTDIWVVVERVFNADSNTVSLFCDLQ